MVLEKVKKILAEQFDVEEEKITPDTLISNDLGADSLDVVDLIMSIEDEFEVEVPDEEAENIKTVEDLVKYIENMENLSFDKNIPLFLASSWPNYRYVNLIHTGGV